MEESCLYWKSSNKIDVTDKLIFADQVFDSNDYGNLTIDFCLLSVCGLALFCF